MWKMKGCPRCGGDILAEWYHGMQREMCLQCGYRKESQIKTGVRSEIKIKREVAKNV